MLILYFTIYCIVLTTSQYYFCASWMYLHQNSIFSTSMTDQNLFFHSCPLSLCSRHMVSNMFGMSNHNKNQLRFAILIVSVIISYFSRKPLHVTILSLAATTLAQLKTFKTPVYPWLHYELLCIDCLSECMFPSLRQSQLECTLREIFI